MKKIIAPSILAADLSNLQKLCEMLEKSAAEWIHIDVMDGVFVPNISFGFPVLEAVRRHTRKHLDVHLMIQNPDKYIERFRAAGADTITFHLETSQNPQQTIAAIRATGAQVGITINPNVQVDALTPFLKNVDLTLLMSVFAGFGGQKFIPETFGRIARLQELKIQQNASFLIEIDGGITSDNAPALFEAGVNVLVAGSAVFRAKNPQEYIQLMLGI